MVVRFVITGTSSRFFFFQAEDGIRYPLVTGVQTCALPISQWTSARGRQHRRHSSASCDVRSVRLQKCPGKKLRKRSNLLVEPSTKLPVGSQKRNPRIGRHCSDFSRGCGKCIRSVLFHKRKKCTKFWKHQRDVQALAQRIKMRNFQLLLARFGDLRKEILLKAGDSLVEEEQFAR